MKNLFCLLATVLISTPAFASQTLAEAIQLKPEIGAMVEALKKSAGVDCLLDTSFVSFSIKGPEGKKAVTHQVACFDPDAFNPSQLGQLMVTYYGDAETATSPVGAVIEINFEVFK